MANEKRTEVREKIGLIIKLAKSGLSSTQVHDLLESLGRSMTQDYVTHTIRAWELTGKSDDPEEVRLKKQERKKPEKRPQPISEKVPVFPPLSKEVNNSIQWFEVEVLEAKRDRKDIIQLLERILECLTK